METLPRQCSKPSCKNTLPPEEPGQQLYKKCADCHTKNKLATTKAREKKRKRVKEEDESPKRQAPTKPQDLGQNREEDGLREEHVVDQQHNISPCNQMEHEVSDTQEMKVRAQVIE